MAVYVSWASSEVSRRTRQANRSRDRKTEALWADAGWTVLRFWEHEGPVDIAETIIVTVRPELSS